MEAISAIANSTATQFQMQQATNITKPLPFPTVKETAILQKAYDSAAIRGCPSQPAIATLVRETGVGVKEIKAWFTDERKLRGHAGHGETLHKEATPLVEVRAQLPNPTRGHLPAATYTPIRKGEYFEEEMKVDVSPSWLEPPTGGITLYAYGAECSAPPGFPILDMAPLLDRTDAESQDSGFGCARPAEINIKEHVVEGFSTAPDVQNPARNITEGTPGRPSTRDPRTRHVSVASPLSLYGRAETPMADQQNIAQSRPDGLFQGRSNEEVSLPSDDEDRLVINVEDE